MRKNGKATSVLIILGNQLFPLSEIEKIGVQNIFMVEDFDLCTYEKHHKLKILMVLGAMRHKRDELLKNGFDVTYLSMDQKNFKESFEDKLEKYLKENNLTEIKMFEIEDKRFEERLTNFSRSKRIPLLFLPSPMFLLRRYECSELMGKSSSLRMGNFYKQVRKKFNLLLNKDKTPAGGKWSFDAENRKKLPHGVNIPPQPKIELPQKLENLKATIQKHFGDHPGSLEHAWMPITREQALYNLTCFLKDKLKLFGDYEDAITSKDNFIFHSALSPSLNIGLITPQDILTQTLAFSTKHDIPLNSLEGFLRQVVGWREFIRGVYQRHSNEQEDGNFFNHTKKLKKSWYEANTGIQPLDDTILFTIKYGYTHHINRLMIISNIMTLCEIHPRNAYNWFMEMYIDSSDWVMTPNVFGMGTFADGGIFSTKPYICGSNYILKMSDYKQGDWSEILDGLYWRFVAKNIEKLKANPRLSLLKNTLNNMDAGRRKTIIQRAEQFISSNCE